jgi:hypothetical protein
MRANRNKQNFLFWRFGFLVLGIFILWLTVPPYLEKKFIFHRYNSINHPEWSVSVYKDLRKFYSASGQDVMYYFVDLREVSIEEDYALKYYKAYLNKGILDNPQVTKLSDLQRTTGEFQRLNISDKIVKNKKIIVITQYIMSKY